MNGGSRPSEDRLALHREVFRRFVEDVINSGDERIATDVIAEDFRPSRTALNTALTTLVGGGTQAISADASTGRETFLRGLRALRVAFPDWHHEVHEIVADGDLVAGRWTMTGTHRGTFLGVDPTGHRVTMEEAGFTRILDGKVVSGWYVGDELSFLHTLAGVQFPADG